MLTLRNKIILYFLLILFIISLTLLGLNYYVTNYPKDLTYYEKFKNYCFYTSDIVAHFEKNYGTENFDSTLDKYDHISEVFILSKNNIILYDTLGNRYKSKKLQNVLNAYYTYWNSEVTLGGRTYRLDIIPADKYKNIKQILSLIPFMFIISLLIIFVISLIILTKLLSKYVLDPIDTLEEGIDHMLHGNFNFKLNEIPKTSSIYLTGQKFIKMKNQTRDTLNKERQLKNSRKELLAGVTHDLKTPLTSIKGYVEALQDGIVKDRETYEKYLSIIHKKTTHLNNLINDLFIFSKLDLNNFSFNKEVINSKKFLLNYYNNKKLEFEHTTIDFSIEKPIISTTINIDSQKITQVLENLIENSKKFTHSYIKIYTSINQNNLVIHIEDNGIGISKENHNKIFELFYKENKSRSNPEKSGSGIGLAISKKIIKGHHGEISFTSIPNIKTVFSIELPIHFNNKDDSLKV